MKFFFTYFFIFGSLVSSGFAAEKEKLTKPVVGAVIDKQIDQALILGASKVYRHNGRYNTLSPLGEIGLNAIDDPIVISGKSGKLALSAGVTAGLIEYSWDASDAGLVGTGDGLSSGVKTPPFAVLSTATLGASAASYYSALIRDEKANRENDLASVKTKLSVSDGEVALDLFVSKIQKLFALTEGQKGILKENLKKEVSGLKKEGQIDILPFMLSLKSMHLSENQIDEVRLCLELRRKGLFDSSEVKALGSINDAQKLQYLTSISENLDVLANAEYARNDRINIQKAQRAVQDAIEALRNKITLSKLPAGKTDKNHEDCSPNCKAQKVD